MSAIDNLDTDIINFFKEIENQNNNDKKKTLKLLMDKYIHLSKSEYVMDYYDLSSIISNAKNIWVDKSFPIYIGDKKKRVYETEQNSLCTIESTINFLNRNNCLKRMAKFDYKEL